MCLLGEQASSSPSFRSAFAPRGMPSPEFQACCTGTTSLLAFRPAFPPRRVTSPEFRAFCKHGSSIVACFPGGFSSRKNHSSGIPSFVQARELHLRLFFGLHFLQGESRLRNSAIPSCLQARELHLRFLFGRHFLQEASHLQNSKLTASTETLFRLLISCAETLTYMQTRSGTYRPPYPIVFLTKHGVFSYDPSFSVVSDK